MNVLISSLHLQPAPDGEPPARKSFGAARTSSLHTVQSIAARRASAGKVGHDDDDQDHHHHQDAHDKHGDDDSDDDDAAY